MSASVALVTTLYVVTVCLAYELVRRGAVWAFAKPPKPRYYFVSWESATKRGDLVFRHTGPTSTTVVTAWRRIIAKGAESPPGQVSITAIHELDDGDGWSVAP